MKPQETTGESERYSGAGRRCPARARNACMRAIPWPGAIAWSTAVCWSGLLMAQSSAPADGNPPIPPVNTSITVTDRITADAPAFVSTLDQTHIGQLPGVNLDDRLRILPGFSLFRRSSSLVANPGTQGVSLRGLGSTGASRTLVLWDGIPLNDPFGGWVYWTRVAPEDLGVVEVSRGASTSVFGDLAMGGAISLFSRPEAPFHAELGIESGAESTNQTHGSMASTWGRLGASLELRALGTDGYFIVPGYLRGSADRRANVRFVSGAARFDWLAAHDRFFVKLDMLAEERQNGTALTNNSTSLGTLSAHYSHELSQGVVSVLAWRTQEDFRSTYSAVSANRATEVLTDRQKVPSDAAGAAAYAQRSAQRWHFTAGADVSGVEGYSHDASPTRTPAVAGGTQLQDGAFGQFDISRGPAQFFAGARYDATGVADRFFAPSAGVAAGKGMLRGRGSVYRGFRAPKLNELYRPFRVGNVQTLANPLLLPETLFGAEAGFDLSGRTRRLSLTVFRNSLNHLITNATLSTGPNLILRQKENAGPALSRGVEANLQQRWRNWQGQLGYLYADSRFQTGLAIPEVPRHQGSAQLSYERRRTGASISLRTSARQFDDDLNQFVLPGYAAVQFSARREIRRHLTATVAIENLLDRQYVVARSPTPNIGAPRLWRTGLRWAF